MGLKDRRIAINVYYESGQKIALAVYKPIGIVMTCHKP